MNKKNKKLRCPLCEKKCEELDVIKFVSTDQGMEGCIDCLFFIYYNFDEENVFKPSWDLLMKFEEILKLLEINSDSESDSE